MRAADIVVLHLSRIAISTLTPPHAHWTDASWEVEETFHGGMIALDIRSRRRSDVQIHVLYGRKSWTWALLPPSVPKANLTSKGRFDPTAHGQNIMLFA